MYFFNQFAKFGGKKKKRAKGWIMYGMDIKLKLKATQKNSEKTKKKWGI